MKKEFIKILAELAEKDKDIYFLTGDLGFNAFENFAKLFPKRFIDCGVAEQNMAGLAAGLALEGKKPYIYSIIPFAVFRCLEQIRNNICYQNLNVKIIGAGAGFSYSTEDFTHYGTEDISALISFPNISIFSPADVIEVKEIILQSYKKGGPAYIRLSKTEKTLHDTSKKISIGRTAIVKDGKKIAVISTGTCLEQALKAAEKFRPGKVKVISAHTLKPVDEKKLLEQVAGAKLIITIEEHCTSGGLASVINNILIRNNIKGVFVKNIGLKEGRKNMTGKQDFLQKFYKLDEASIYKEIMAFYGK